MQITFPRVTRMNARAAAALISALVGLGGAIVAIAASPYAPASHAFVTDRVDSALQATNARMSHLQREGNETRLQINQLRAEALRSSKFQVDQAMASTTDQQIKQVLQQRSEELGTAIVDVSAERERLRAQSP